MLRDDCRHPETVQIAVARGSLFLSLVVFLRSIGCNLHEQPDRNGFLGNGFGGNWENVRFFLRDRRVIPQLVAHGNFDAGITGLDILVDSGIPIDVLYSFPSPESYWTLATRDDCLLREITTVGCELHRNFAQRLLGPLSACDIVPIEGYEECAIEDGLCDGVLLVTVTGKSIREKKGLQIYPGCERLFTSKPVVIAGKNGGIHQQEAVTAFIRALQETSDTSKR